MGLPVNNINNRNNNNNNINNNINQNQKQCQSHHPSQCQYEYEYEYKHQVFSHSNNNTNNDTTTNTTTKSTQNVTINKYQTSFSSLLNRHNDAYSSPSLTSVSTDSCCTGTSITSDSSNITISNENKSLNLAPNVQCPLCNQWIERDKNVISKHRKLCQINLFGDENVKSMCLHNCAFCFFDAILREFSQEFSVWSFVSFFLLVLGFACNTF